MTVMRVEERIESQIIQAVLGVAPSPPVDLFAIAGRIGVSSYGATDFPHGYTDFGSESPVIFLNSRECGARMRFVLAHEIAHVMLHMPQARYILEVSRQVRLLDDEEELADRVAAAMLIPDIWVAALSDVRIALAGLYDFARLAGVPLTVLIARMSSVGIRIGLLHWWRGDHSWHVVGRPGVPACLHGRFELSESSRLKFEELGSREKVITVEGSVDHCDVQIRAPALKRGSEVFQLISPLYKIRLGPIERSIGASS
jgi:hypothetical protein